MIIMPQRDIRVSNFFVLVGIKMQDNLSLLLDQVLNDHGAVPGSLLYHKVSQMLIARCKVGFSHLFHIHCPKDEFSSIGLLQNFCLNCPLLFAELVYISISLFFFFDTLKNF